MDKPKQIEAKIIGEKGCYFLSIVNGVSRYCAEKKDPLNVDIIRLYEVAMDEGWISNDCYVERPDLIAAYIMGVSLAVLKDAMSKNKEILEVKIAKKPLAYMPANNEIEITRYEKEATGVTFSHFVVTRDGEVIHDPYGNSNTVSKGYPVSKRILTVNI
ncbi:DUF261 family protein [Treponema sp.]|uniref:DUF261 family protein n=1 Tax=Treponema sp. TaxID=166 RepID=UPI00298E9DE3|nr:DUF261 family protein [Treponema sp.]MCQ2242467.1 DUF261 domain-containing protein [Treponema sp.]